MDYFYVQEDDLAASARSPRWVEGHPMFSVYEAEVDWETRTFGPAQRICSGLGPDAVKWFYSFPETRALLIEEWQHMQKHNTWRGGTRNNWRLSRLVLKAREQHGPERTPEPLYLRTELVRYLGQRPASLSVASEAVAQTTQRIYRYPENPMKPYADIALAQVDEQLTAGAIGAALSAAGMYFENAGMGLTSDEALSGGQEKYSWPTTDGRELVVASPGPGGSIWKVLLARLPSFDAYSILAWTVSEEFAGAFFEAVKQHQPFDRLGGYGLLPMATLPGFSVLARKCHVCSCAFYEADGTRTLFSPPCLCPCSYDLDCDDCSCTGPYEEQEELGTGREKEFVTYTGQPGCSCPRHFRVTER